MKQNKVQRNGVLLLVLAIILFVCACTPQKQFEVVYPESLLRFSQTDAETIAEMYRADKTFCQDAYVRGKDAVLIVTQEQFGNLQRDNEQKMQKIRDDLSAINMGYWLEESGDYTSFKLYCDENIPVLLNLITLQGLSGYYAVAQVLQGNEDWSVEITVVNCHTNKTVAQFRYPGETGSYGAEEWAESYKVDEATGG